MIPVLRFGLLTLIVATDCLAGVYYVSATDPNATDDGGGTQAHPWKTLGRVGRQRFAPGDSILFARGSSFTGRLMIRDSGTIERPITLSSYGTGPAPKFTNPDFGILDGNVIRVVGSHVIVEGLFFHDGVAAPAEAKSVFRMGAVFVDREGDHSVIRDSEVVDCPIGFNVQAEACVVTGNEIHDCIRFLKPPGWGPIGIFIGNANIEISHNRIRRYVATGGTYGADGWWIVMSWAATLYSRGSISSAPQRLVWK